MKHKQQIAHALLVVIATFTVGCKHTSTMSSADASKVIIKFQNQEMAKRLRQQAADDLTDPDAARFRHLILYNSSRTGALPADVEAGVYTLCGQINGKNQMGGYVGYREFASMVIVTAGPEKPGETNNFVFIADPERTSSSVQDDCKGQTQDIRTNDEGDLLTETVPNER